MGSTVKQTSSRRGLGRRCVIPLAFAAGLLACTEPERSYEASRYNAFGMVSPSRGRIFGTVYLPPTWDPSGQREYPLLVFLGRGRGDSSLAAAVYPADSLNHWIAAQVLPPMVIVEVEYASFAEDAEPWSSARNATFLTSEARRELRAVSLRRFRAGGSPETTSIQGFSFGARGALHYALGFPDRFASAVADAFVSDYALDEERDRARANLERILDTGIPIRMSIGSRDEWVLQRGQQASYVMHEFLDSLGVAHEFEVLPGLRHDPGRMSRFVRPDGTSHGLYGLQFHARAWKRSR
jgi:pimeloyl-ACP methyl ester carboxylesterase